MEETAPEKAQRFLEYIHEMVEVAVDSANLKNQAVHSKVLLSALFDSISKSAFPNIRQNALRYKQLIDFHSEWDEANKISLLHLLRLLEREENLSSEFEDINEWCISEYSSKFPNTNRLLKSHSYLAKDPDINNVLELWPTDSNGTPIKLRNVNPEQLTHKHLFWLYRNSLVHEYRNPGNGVERIANGENVPFYHELSTVTSLNNEGLQFTNNWELVYPFGFFKELCLVAAKNVSRMHANNDTSPFSAYICGTYWIPTFNE